jgi:DNA-binding GntR family transcriptional regulator
MPLRQAIQRLSAIGLVEVKPRSGTFVAKVNTRELEETLDIRAALESLAASTAVEFVTQDDLDELDGILSEMEGITRGRHGIDRHDRLNTVFHQRIIEIARNRKLAEIYEGLHAHIQIARVHLRSADWSSRVAREQQEHRDILTALAARDAATLAQRLRDHIERGKFALLGDLATNAGAA